MPHTRSVSISFFLGVGSRYEPDEQAGISHYMEHMIFKGTKRRPLPQEISAAIEGTGGIINAATEQELTVLWCKVARPHFESSLDLFFDVIRNSVMEPESIEKERLVVFEELAMINDYPNYRVDAIIDEMLWPDHPLGRDIGGSKESVTGITREMLLDFMAEYYTPSNMVVSVAGNVSHEYVVEQVEALCKGWTNAKSSGWKPFISEQVSAQSRLEYRKTEQAHLSIALPGISQEDPDRYALDLLSVMLGEGMSSRLFVEVREKKGLAYDVHSGVAHFMDTGAFVVTAGVDPKRVYDALQTILEQIGGMKESVPEEELQMAKNLSTGRLLLRMEDTRAVASWMGNQELLLGKILDIDDVIADVNRVTVEDVRRLGNEILVSDKLNVALVGPSRGHKRVQNMLKL